MKKFFLCLSLIFFCACSGTLVKDGAYHGDKALYSADKAIVTSYDVLHSFVKWEFDNRAVLSKWPEIKQAADLVRQNARRWITSAEALRDAYNANPTPENADALKKALAVLDEALTQATAYMAKPLTK